MQYTKDQASAVLTRLGWHPRTPYLTAVEALQATVGITVDGIVGPVTSGVMAEAVKLASAGKPTIPTSPYHSFSDFMCHCSRTGPPRPGCKSIYALPEFIDALDVYARFHRGKPDYASTYRCPSWNASVGGATNSQHLYGAAADVPLIYALPIVAGLRVFSGIGWQAIGSTRDVRHVDARHLSGHNLTGGTVGNPTVWNY